ncbi:hypothetical protein TBLA_0G02460 [Henningerozyma blattae CBS 6284]|uniref:6-phosphofructo-2-kinase domain-containing protein n=1 Tax=Henningerozyma blattae (strain ATCC 34711 / CBS 6284 / DSM 70876 / NBRC 10599 / NRRL Y-10934 / UCD 77-7) TaxID=1071380 RepID=I2H734_HENB6|nr:hypothetical protein TBLA_0G02460 [Tetrapisispora blattae CBS 6284]CCH62186.1 hypothetical protein TBLA_0G02460 [Tetrapisispora blattae CBS 6284]
MNRNYSINPSPTDTSEVNLSQENKISKIPSATNKHEQSLSPTSQLMSSFMHITTASSSTPSNEVIPIIRSQHKGNYMAHDDINRNNNGNTSAMVSSTLKSHSETSPHKKRHVRIVMDNNSSLILESDNDTATTSVTTGNTSATSTANSSNNASTINSNSNSSNSINSLKDNKKLPSFMKRPLSDTPITSNWQSPKMSRDTTPNITPDLSCLGLYSMNEVENEDEIDNATTIVQDKDIDQNTERNDDTLKLNLEDNIEEPILFPSTPATSSKKNAQAPSEVKNFLKLPENLDSNSQIPSGTRSPSKFKHPKKKRTTIDVPGLTNSVDSPNGITTNKDMSSKLIIIMVGLPATGKSFITNKLSRYLNYTMYSCKVFNVGNTRRQYAKEHNLKEQDSKFFNPNDTNCKELRDKWAIDTLDELIDYLMNDNGVVGIFDATNTTFERRKKITRRIHDRCKEVEVMFLETICSDQKVVEKNIRLKLFGPDYKGKNPHASLLDFKERLSNYKKAYQPIVDEENLEYIKMIDIGKKIITYNITGYLASQTVYYLLNFTLKDRQIWITRSGESEDNMFGKIGGDSKLSIRGEKYAKALNDFLSRQREIFNSKVNANLASTPNSRQNSTGSETDEDEYNQFNEFFIWSSTRRRCIDTMKKFDSTEFPQKQMKMLDELNCGNFEGMTYSQIQKNYPKEFDTRQTDKLVYRYPGIGGESYMDVINRVKPVIMEIERIEDNVLIITHRVIARILLGYFLNLSKDIITNLDVPLHCVYCLETKPYGIDWSLWEYDESKNDFFKIPKDKLNLTRVKEVGLVYKERRYSIIPTAPPSANGKKYLSANISGKNYILNEHTPHPHPNPKSHHGSHHNRHHHNLHRTNFTPVEEGEESIENEHAKDTEDGSEETHDEGINTPDPSISSNYSFDGIIETPREKELETDSFVGFNNTSTMMNSSSSVRRENFMLRQHQQQDHSNYPTHNILNNNNNIQNMHNSIYQEPHNFNNSLGFRRIKDDISIGRRYRSVGDETTNLKNIRYMMDLGNGHNGDANCVKCPPSSFEIDKLDEKLAKLNMIREEEENRRLRELYKEGSSPHVIQNIEKVVALGSGDCLESKLKTSKFKENTLTSLHNGSSTN